MELNISYEEVKFMKFVLQVIDLVAIGKLINHTGTTQDNEIEITEEQYNQVNEFPLKLILDKDEKVVDWERIEIEYKPAPEPPKELTLAEEVEELKQLVADLASLQLGV